MEGFDPEVEEFSEWMARRNYQNILSWWRSRWWDGSLGAGIVLFQWEG